jgi:hypothetical protein
MEYLSRYTFQLECMRGVDNSAADALSRNPAFAAVSTRTQCRLASGGGDHLPDRRSHAKPFTQPDIVPVRTPITAMAKVPVDNPDAEPLQDVLLRAYDSDSAFQKAPPVYYEKDSSGLWWWQGRVVVPKDATLRHQIL